MSDILDVISMHQCQLQIKIIVFSQELIMSR